MYFWVNGQDTVRKSPLNKKQCVVAIAVAKVISPEAKLGLCLATQHWHQVCVRVMPRLQWGAQCSLQAVDWLYRFLFLSPVSIIKNKKNNFTLGKEVWHGWNEIQYSTCFLLCHKEVLSTLILMESIMLWTFHKLIDLKYCTVPHINKTYKLIPVFGPNFIGLGLVRTKKEQAEAHSWANTGRTREPDSSVPTKIRQLNSSSPSARPWCCSGSRQENFCTTLNHWCAAVYGECAQ